MKIQQIRSATVKIQYGGVHFLVDPWLEDRGTGFSAKAARAEMIGVKTPLNDLPFSPEEVLSDVGVCLVTHLHPDHFTPAYLPADLRLVLQNPQDERTVMAMGFVNTESFQTDRIVIDGVSVTRVCGVHGDTSPLVEAMGTVSGFILQHPEEHTLYIAGDTIYYEGVGQTLAEYAPDVIILNCCEATNPMGRLLMHCGDVAAVCRAVPAATVIASHLDSVNHALVSSEEMRRYVRENGLTRVMVPRNGETIFL